MGVVHFLQLRVVAREIYIPGYFHTHAHTHDEVVARAGGKEARLMIMLMVAV